MQWSKRWKALARVCRARADHYKARAQRAENEILSLRGLISTYPPHTEKYPGGIDLYADTAAAIAAARARCIDVCKSRIMGEQ